jgi:hypothetical protein
MIYFNSSMRRRLFTQRECLQVLAINNYRAQGSVPPAERSHAEGEGKIGSKLTAVRLAFRLKRSSLRCSVQRTRT